MNYKPQLYKFVKGDSLLVVLEYDIKKIQDYWKIVKANTFRKQIVE
jgi:hypothetical protein